MVLVLALVLVLAMALALVLVLVLVDGIAAVVEDPLSGVPQWPGGAEPFCTRTISPSRPLLSATGDAGL